MEYVYFVSYNFNDGISCGGSGNTSIVFDHQITSMDDINEITEYLKKTCNFIQVVIINFQLLKINNQ